MTYAAEVAADSPVAWWALDETTGTNAEDDGSGTDADGTYTGGYTLGEVGIDAADAGGGTSVLFNGSSGYVAIGAVPTKLQFASDFTIEAWCASDEALSAPGAAVVSEAFAGDGNVRYMLGFYDGSAVTRKPTFGWFNGAWRLAVSADALDSNFHHLVGTYDSGTNELELWVDGASVATHTPGGTQPTGTEDLYIGRRWDAGPSQYFNGWIDEVALYAAKLSSTRIAAHYGAFNTSQADVRVTSLAAEVLTRDPTNDRRVTSLAAEVLTRDPTNDRRVTSLAAEVMGKFDFGGWGVHVDEWGNL